MAIHPQSTRLAVINFQTSGDNAVVPASANGPINVYGIFFTVAGATNITFKTGATALSGPVQFTGTGSSMVLELKDEPWFPCVKGDNFIINSSSAVQISGTVYYTNG